MSLQASDFPIIAAAREGLGVPEDTEATPAQTLQLLRIVPEDVAERMVANWREMAQQGVACWLRNHERELGYWREIATHRVCGVASEEVPGFGRLKCERPAGHDGPHREREDGHVWATA